MPRCSCNQRLFYQSADGKVRLRSAVVVFKSEGAVAICPKCKREVPVDLVLGESLQKALVPAERKLVVRDLRKSLDEGKSAP
jgi:hypothetical protein